MWLQKVVVLHKFEVLQVVGVGLADALSAVIHKSEQNIGF